MPDRNPEADRQRTGRPTTLSLDLVFVALNPDFLPALPRAEMASV
jgi:hypothetical protein